MTEESKVSGENSPQDQGAEWQNMGNPEEDMSAGMSDEDQARYEEWMNKREAGVEMEDFEGDYWNISTIPALRHFEKTCYQGEELKVALMVDAGGGQTEALMNSDRLRIVDESEADYFLFNVSALNDPSVLNEYELKSGLEQDGYLISGVYIRKGR